MDKTNPRGWPVLSPLAKPEDKPGSRPVVEPQPYQYNRAMEVDYDALAQKEDRRHFVIGLITIFVILAGVIYGIWALWL